MRKGWSRRRISDIAEHSLGKMLDKAKNVGEPQPYLRNLNVRWFEFDLSDLLEMRFRPEEHARYTVRKGDLVICEGGYPGRAAIWEHDEPIHFQKALHRVRFHEPERAKWFLYYLHFRDIEGTLKQHFNGAGIQHFTGEALARFEIPLPTLAEQRRIVSILDEAFAGLEAIRANAEKNLQNARELFEARLNAVFAEDYENESTVPLSELATDITDGDHMPPPKSESGIPFITIGNVDKVSRKIDFTDTFLVPHDYHSRLKPNRRPKKGDVLYTVTGSFGIPVLVEDDTQFCFQRHIGLIRPKPAIDSAWLNYLLLSAHIFKQAESGATGTAQKTVSLKVLRNFVVPFPSTLRQKATVASLDKLAAGTSRLAELYQRKLAAIDELKQSILQKAFAGELTATAAVAA